MLMMSAGMLHRAAARDHALLARLQLSPDASELRRAAWALVTHAGGAITTLLVSLAPLWFENPMRDGARRSAVLLVASHLLVQLVKRTVSRPRPDIAHAAVKVPDRFSFPSGHAAAAASVALGYSSAYPFLAVPLLCAGAIVGASRVVLGVHFPADVLAGQLLALVTAAAAAPLL
jgi:undecaprenyl-diphosphatase